jgi:hypothetical protein
VRLSEADKEPEELLVSDVQVVAARVTATIDDRPGLDALPVGQKDDVGTDLRDFSPQSHPVSQPRCDNLVQTL